jgi:hypothetical protein
MTLILGMSKAEGIYMSTDYRVTRAGRLVDVAAVKFLDVMYPPLEEGPRALLAYTGIALLPDGTPTGTWIRETVRGESEGFDKSMDHLRSRLDRDIAPLGEPLILNVMVMYGERRFFGGLTNVRIRPGKWRADLMESFVYDMNELDKPFVFANGSGAAKALANRFLHRVQEQLSARPRRPHDHMKLLAIINRRVAAKDLDVSPFCHVTFLNAPGEDPLSARSDTFTKRDESPVPFEMPLVMVGIDDPGLSRGMMERFKSMKEGEGPDEEDDDSEFSDEDLKRGP